MALVIPDVLEESCATRQAICDWALANASR